MQIKYETVRKGTTLYYVFLNKINDIRYKIEIYSRIIRTKRNFLLENGFAAEPAKRMMRFNKEKVLVYGDLNTASYKFEQALNDIKAGMEMEDVAKTRSIRISTEDEIDSNEITDYIIRKREDGFTYFEIAEYLMDEYNVSITLEAVRGRYIRACEERGINPILKAPALKKYY